MPMKRYKAERIVTLLRQIEVGIANGKPTPQACKEAEITIQTYYRWRREYGGPKLNQAKRMKQLERENAKLKRSEQRQELSENFKAKQIKRELPPIPNKPPQRSIVIPTNIGGRSRRSR
jgi:putative transposase